MTFFHENNNHSPNQTHDVLNVHTHKELISSMQNLQMSINFVDATHSAVM